MWTTLEYLPADLFGLSEPERAALSADPTVSGVPDLPGLIVPRQLAALPIPEDRFDVDERADLVSKWESRLSALEPHVAVLDGLRSLAQPGTFAVLAQAPPHFCGGAFEVVYRALHAIRLARALAETWRRPVVPVFWNRADEHRLKGVRELLLLDRHFDLRGVSPTGLEQDRQPISRLPLDSEKHRLNSLREFLRQELSGSKNLSKALEIAFPRHGETLADSFTRWLIELFGPLGLVVIEPDWVRPELSRSLAGIVADDPTAGSRASDTEAPALVYRVDRESRAALRPGGDGFRFDRETGSRTPSELAAEIVQDPERWSPADRLLPLAQEQVLPLAARIGTWKEWADLSSTIAFQQRTDRHPAPFVPALRGTVVDPGCSRALEKGSIQLRELLAGMPRPAETPAGDAIRSSAPVAERMRETGARAARELRALRSELAELDRRLSAQLKRTATDVEARVENMAQRVDRCFRNRGGKDSRRLRRLTGSLLPHGEPQETRLASLPFFARYGYDWLETLLEELDPLPTEHLVIRLWDSEPPSPGPGIEAQLDG